jgi:KamA family protein
MSKNDTRTIEQLAQHTSFTASESHELSHIIDGHPMAVNKYYMDLIDWDDQNDPIRKMAIPSIEENSLEGSFDTSGEQKNTKVRGLQHKYKQTALILVTNDCATYCRHCFRKRLVGKDVDEIVSDWDLVVEYLTKHKEITNVLLSGGDPLTLPTDEIAGILDRLSGISHLKYIRIGTRTPVVFPGRIVEDPKLVDVLSEYSRKNKRLYLTTQFNHPKEITQTSIEAINILNDARITINNQTVLLNGVNDDPVVMAELQTKLVQIGVVPYYIFQCRPVKTIKDVFQVPLPRAIAIIEETRSMLDGLSKRFRFVMSHNTGKIEILGILDGKACFRYHQTPDTNLSGSVFQKEINDTTSWLDL